MNAPKPNDAPTRWCVGPETDDALVAKLDAVLRKLGYIVGSKDWVLGGSQEIVTWAARRSGDELLVESETYIGVTLIGPERLVAEVQAAMDGGQSDDDCRDA